MKIPKIIPRGKQILVKPSEEGSRVSEYGLSAPSNDEREQKSTGIVIAVGSGVDDIKKGDCVVYGTFAGDDIEISGEDHKLVDEEYVLAFIE